MAKSSWFGFEMTKVINLLGGPGAGKSTNATGAFSKLKRHKISCEYVNEYAKEVTWENAHKLLECQQHIFGEQYRRQWRLNGTVEYIITDSPILLSAVYLEHYNPRVARPLPDKYVRMASKYFMDTFNLFDNINVYVDRTKEYDPIGRSQTEIEARAIDVLVMRKLTMRNQKVHILTNSDLGDLAILEYVLKEKGMKLFGEGG